MANQTIPITLSPGVIPPGTQAIDINALLAIFCQYVSAGIIADGQFIIFTQNDPATNQAPLIFNTTQHVFKYWSAGVGRYIPITQFENGDVKTSFAGIDSLGTGWVVLNGRPYSAITGLTANQQSVLEIFFGPGPLPTVSPQNISGLPPNGSFSNIPWPPAIHPTVTPTAATIASITFTNPVVDTEAAALRDATETLRDSVQDTFDVTKQIQAQAEFTLNALNNTGTPPMYALMFIGFPA